VLLYLLIVARASTPTCDNILTARLALISFYGPVLSDSCDSLVTLDVHPRDVASQRRDDAGDDVQLQSCDVGLLGLLRVEDGRERGGLEEDSDGLVEEVVLDQESEVGRALQGSVEVHLLSQRVGLEDKYLAVRELSEVEEDSRVLVERPRWTIIAGGRHTVEQLLCLVDMD
jgi:hypothetical protein